LRAFYEIDVIVDQPQVSGDWIEATGRPRGVEWFQEHFHRYDRVLYQLGNSPIHKHMIALIEKVPGVVVLHDFFLSELQARRGKKLFLRALKESHGYGAVMRHLSGDKFPASLAVIQSAQGVVVHTKKLREAASQWYGDGIGDEFEVIPYTYAFSNVTKDQREEARNRLGFPKDALLICSFSSLTTENLNNRLLSSFLSSTLVKEANIYLIFVGETGGAEFEQGLYRLVSRSGIAERIRLTGFASHETLARYLKAADIAIQLNGDGAGVILDCMSYGVPTVISANEAIPDIDRDGVWMLDCPFEDDELTEVLETLAQNPALREKIGAKAQDLIRASHSPEGCAALYFDAIEKFCARDENEVGGLMRKLSEARFAASDTPILASTLSRNFPPRPRLRQLLVDISELVHRDAKTGIQRVVRAILSRWLSNPPRGWLVEPVYASLDRPGYRYARQFICAFLEMDASWTEDAPVDAWSGDIFIALDFQSHVIPAQHELLDRWYRCGVDIRFVVYDLLPVLMPQHFYNGASENHAAWLAFITRYNGAICISQSVTRELRDWCDAHTAPRSVPFIIDWFHLGADIGMSVPSLGMTTDEERSLRCVRGVPTFLMVGTIEPRKGHQQVLGAFEILWRKGIEAKLIIVGKPGWKTEDFVERVKEHPELGNRVIWHKNATDEYLKQIYSVSTSLIAASEGEGFGLPVIEAAQHGLPIIARDLQVFREVAGEHAFYFKGLRPEDLATALTEWLKLYQAKSHIQSSDMSWLTWAQSAEMLLARLGIKATTPDTNLYVPLGEKHKGGAL
jgi:glycosyltransferase involved in cell wall biosynthesis